jgi:hypothetical protein
MKIGNVCPVNKVERPPEPPYLGDVRQKVPGPHESAGAAIVPVNIIADEDTDGATGFIRICKHCGALYWESTDE